MGTCDRELILLVVNMGQGSTALRHAKKHGVTGGTICLAHGTIKSKLLEFLELNDIRREIVIMAAERGIARETLDALNRDFSLHKPGHGIAVTIPLAGLFGVHEQVGDSGHGGEDERKGKAVKEKMYQAIFTVVDKGMAEKVVEVGKAAGARGGTIINARGSGIHETEVLFSMAIEPEKEVVMIIAERAVAEKVVPHIRKELQIDEAGKGIMFVLDVSRAVGLY